MSEQANNSQDPNARVEEALFKTFGGEDAPPSPVPASRARDPETGKFVPTGAQQQQAQADEPGTEQQGDPEGQEPAQEAAQQSEEVEVEIEGEKYLVPKKISDRFIQHADYTRKTQDIAEMRRALSAEKEAASLEQAFSQQTVQERTQLALLDAQIEQFKNVNWGAIEDTGQLIKLREQLNQLKDTRATVDASIKAKRGQFDEKIKSMTQEALTAGMKYIQQNIKGYDEKMQSKLNDYGRSRGFTAEEMGRVIDPRFVVVLHDAAQWAELVASQPNITKRAASAAPVVRPGATQKQVSRVQQLNKAFKDAKSDTDKKQAAEDYFAARLG